MEEKELNLCELLEGYEEESFYSPMFGYARLISIANGCIKVLPESSEYIELWSDGKYHTLGLCVLWPSEELYEKYPLNPYAAWMEWKEERKPNRWRAKEGEEYFILSEYLDVCSYIADSDFSGDSIAHYETYNYFRTKEEAEQAAEIVREALAKFYKQNAEK